MKTYALKFVRDVDPIEIALLANAVAWRYFFASTSPTVVQNAFYRQLTHALPAIHWEAGATLLVIAQIIAIALRNRRVKHLVYIVNIGAEIFVNVTMVGLNIVTLLVPLNTGLLVATFYALLSDTIRGSWVKDAVMTPQTNKRQGLQDRIVWSREYPENMIAVVNALCGIQILNPYIHTLDTSPFGQTLLTFIPAEGVWGAFFLFLGICHYVVRHDNDNRRARRVMCAASMGVWTIAWGLTLIADWHSLGTTILPVLIIQSWVAYCRLSPRTIDGS